MNPIVLNFVALAALTGALLDNFSWGVSFALAACTLTFVVQIAAALKYRRALAAAEAELAAAPTEPSDAETYGPGWPD